MSDFGRAIVFILFAAACLCGQTSGEGAAKNVIVSVPDLGLRYVSPAGMKDKTSSASREARLHAASYTAKAAELMLDMSSGGTDTSPAWSQVWIFIFPRAQLSNLDDTGAEGKMNTALAGPLATPVGKPQGADLAGRNFLVSEFEQKEPPLVKHARVYTTICKTQLVSFVFVSNSAEQVKWMEESLKTLDFSIR